MAVASSTPVMTCKAAKVQGASKMPLEAAAKVSLSLEYALIGHLWPEEPRAVSAEWGGRAQQGSAYGAHALNEPHHGGVVGAEF